MMENFCGIEIKTNTLNRAAHYFWLNNGVNTVLTANTAFTCTHTILHPQGHDGWYNNGVFVFCRILVSILSQNEVEKKS